MQLVIDHSVRDLCRRPYPNHPKGCPNYGKKDECPPRAPLLEKVLDLSKPTCVIWNQFPFGDHVERMRSKHPDWSRRQLECCLYWQGTARKQLRQKVFQWYAYQPDGYEWITLYCPEACGLNVTATMRNMGIELEWPPERFTYQVALIGSLNAEYSQTS